MVLLLMWGVTARSSHFEGQVAVIGVWCGAPCTAPAGFWGLQVRESVLSFGESARVLRGPERKRCLWGLLDEQKQGDAAIAYPQLLRWPGIQAQGARNREQRGVKAGVLRSCCLVGWVCAGSSHVHACGLCACRSRGV